MSFLFWTPKKKGYRVMRYGCEMATGVCEHDSQKYRPYHIGPIVETVGYVALVHYFILQAGVAKSFLLPR